jgi:hypothetical protein
MLKMNQGYSKGNAIQQRNITRYRDYKHDNKFVKKGIR